MRDPIQTTELQEGPASAVTTGVAFLCGVVIGAVAALLLAPQSGQETRRDVERWAGEGREKLSDLRGKAGEAIDRAKEKGRSAVEKGREFVREKRQATGEDVGAGLGEQRVPRGGPHTTG